MSELIINEKTVGFCDKPWDGDIFYEAVRQKIFDKQIYENAYSWVPEDYDFKEAGKSFSKWRKRLEQEKNNG